MTLDDDNKAGLVKNGWQITDHVGDGFTVVAKGNLEEAGRLGTAELRVQAVDDEGFERSGQTSVYAVDETDAPPEIIASVGGWRGHAESTIGLRAHAAVLTYTAERIEAWREREDRLARIATVYPAAAAEARQAGVKTVTITIPLVQAINDLGVIEDLFDDTGIFVPVLEALRAAIRKAQA